MSNKLISCKTCDAQVAKSAKVCPGCGAKVTKAIYKKWWAWVLVIIVSTIIIAVNSPDSTTTNTAQTSSTSKGATASTYDLTKLITMNKADVVKKLGKPSATIYDNETGYSYLYDNEGLSIVGDDKGVTDITLTKANDKYSLISVKIGSSFNKVTESMGKAQTISKSPTGDKIATYLTSEGYSIAFVAPGDSDKISGIMFAKDGSLGDVIE